MSICILYIHITHCTCHKSIYSIKIHIQQPVGASITLQPPCMTAAISVEGTQPLLCPNVK